MQVAKAHTCNTRLWETFEQALQKLPALSNQSHVAVAVSGGADSMALALLCQRWVKQRNAQMTALIVDHGLRAESSQEAAMVQEQLRALDINTEILTLSMAASSAIQEQARDARYEAITSWCHAHDVGYVFLAHHGDDQNETFLFRLLRQSGPMGLACMSMEREQNGIRLVRPLLGVSKRALVDYLSEQHIQWVEDPSNQDMHYSRVQMRHFLQQCSEEECARLHDIIGRFGALREREEKRIASLVQMHVEQHPEGYVKIDCSRLSHEDCVSLLEKALCLVNGSSAQLRQNELRARMNEESERFTFHGCLVERQANSLHVMREFNAVQPSMPLALEGRWDRFHYELNAMPGFAEECEIGALGEKGHIILKHKGVETNLPQAVIATLPAIWHLESPVLVPHMDYVANGYEHFIKNLAFSPAKPFAGVPFCAMNGSNYKE